MKILQICPRIPFPANDGGTIAMTALSRGLSVNKHQVHVFALNTKKHFTEESVAKKNLPPGITLDAAYIDTSVKPFAAFLNIFSDKSYNIERFFSKDAEQKLISVLKKNNYDIVQFESVFVAPYFSCVKKNSKAKTVLRAHNIEHLIWERMAFAENFGLKKIYFNLLAKRLLKFETKIMNRFDALVPITEYDSAIFKNSGCAVPMHVSPVGVDVSQYEINPANSPVSLFHFGSMDWMPNEEALKWFLQHIWNQVHVRFPDLKFYIAGRNLPSWLKQLKLQNVIVEENIPEPKKYIASKSVMIVPLLSGSGMRVKIIEGMASAKAIISTTIGAEGIDITHGRNILIANTPEEFAEQIAACVNNPDIIKNLGSEARKLVDEKYNTEIISHNLAEFYSSLIK